MGKTKDLSKDCKNIVLNLFKFFQLEKARGRPECSNNERLLLDEMHILKMVVKFYTKLSFTVF
jgi:hypothetical protein